MIYHEFVKKEKEMIHFRKIMLRLFEKIRRRDQIHED